MHFKFQLIYIWNSLQQYCNLKLLKKLFLISSLSIISIGNLTFRIEANAQPNSMSYTNMKAKWEVYTTQIKGKTASINVDLSYDNNPNKSKFTNILCIDVKYHMMNEHGFPDKALNGDFINIEKQFNTILTEKNAVFAGRITVNGKRKYFYYINNVTSIKDKIKAFGSEYENFEVITNIKADKDWDTYYDILYPNDEELLTILNKNMTEKLKNQGTDLSKYQSIQHFIYFKNNNEREKFKYQVSNIGYKIVEEDFIKTESKYPYALTISKNDKLELNHINKEFGILLKIAMSQLGKYDGWEIEMVKK